MDRSQSEDYGEHEVRSKEWRIYATEVGGFGHGCVRMQVREKMWGCKEPGQDVKARENCFVRDEAS